ncbi:hypothetical protein CLV88_12159 [Shimia abyssi]|uniref:Uncharacterized protein n=2 Tax=Shimia abyssi TaxID=1662395 RepID=A0A2P8F619_9RHOB|nr:hypothetical protein CLV88_12159 [Shimia abyssi]
MKSAFEIISKGFSRHVFSKLSGDPYLDAVEALNKYHKLSSCQMVSAIESVFGRLKGWAIFRESGSTLATDLADYPSVDDRKVSEAFAGELLNLKEPAVFVVFTRADLDLSRFDAAPLIAFIAAKEMNYGTETDGRIPPGCGTDCTDQRADAETGG